MELDFNMIESSIILEREGVRVLGRKRDLRMGGRWGPRAAKGDCVNTWRYCGGAGVPGAWKHTFLSYLNSEVFLLKINRL